MCPGAQAGEAQKRLHAHQSRCSQVWRQEWGVQRGAWINFVGKLNLGDSIQTLYCWLNMLVEKRIGFSFSGERRDVVYTYPIRRRSVGTGLWGLACSGLAAHLYPHPEDALKPVAQDVTADLGAPDQRKLIPHRPA